MGLYNIPAGCPFFQDLVKGIRHFTQNDPRKMAETTIYLPSRRSCLALHNTFLGQNRAFLLPQIRLLEEGSSSSLTISPLKRRAILLKLVEAFQRSKNPSLWISCRLTEALEHLLDQFLIEGIQPDALQALVPDQYADHWQMTYDFLMIVLDVWPNILKEMGLEEAYERQKRTAEDKFKHHKGLVIAAGFTGLSPLALALLKKVSTLGHVVVPGYIPYPEDPPATSSQYTLHHLVNFLELPCEPWPFSESSPLGVKRLRALQEPLPPLENTTYVECHHLHEEAQVIAAILRETLETPGKTAALITADRSLARRVKTLLKKWGVEIDDSAGTPLLLTPPGVLFHLSAQLKTPVDLLALLKHPLSRIKKSVIRLLERHVIRGSIKPDLNFLEALKDSRIHERAQEILATLTHLEQAFESRHMGTILQAHETLLDTLSQGSVWDGINGEALRQFFQEMKEAALDFPSVDAGEYPFVIHSFIKDQSVRQAHRGHPRLAILGLIESRLTHYDRVILGGLNEGSWPPGPQEDPWLSPTMKKACGLPPEERRVGIAAHDFEQAFTKEEVFLTRSLRVGGSPTVPCRWLLTLDVFQNLPRDNKWLQIVRDSSSPSFQGREMPLPRPALVHRPRKASVTQIETWMKDPYSFYCRHILKLKPLDPIVFKPHGGLKGTLTHKILENYAQGTGELLTLAEDVFSPYMDHVTVKVFWWPQFQLSIPWVIQQHHKAKKTSSEERGTITLETASGLFHLEAKADRIELHSDGTCSIVDYKTGSLPSEKSIKEGLFPQLPLEAVIAHKGGFPSLPPESQPTLSFWLLKPQKEEVKVLKDPDLPEDVLEKVKNLISLFEDPSTPYAPNPQWILEDYRHLARGQEWQH